MNKLILVVDDEPHICKLARDYLEQAGYRVRTAGDGPTAVSIAAHEALDGRLFLPVLDPPDAPLRLRGKLQAARRKIRKRLRTCQPDE